MSTKTDRRKGPKPLAGERKRQWWKEQREAGDYISTLARNWSDMADYLESQKGNTDEAQRDALLSVISKAEAKVYRHCANQLHAEEHAKSKRTEQA